VIRIRTGKFPPSYGKSKDFWSTRWFCESNFDAKYGEWLGCHMIGAGVTDMIAEAIVARKLETTGHEILKSIHTHLP
jgi:dihydrolipoamide dehydrogenase